MYSGKILEEINILILNTERAPPNEGFIGLTEFNLLKK